ncbi:hypothetical protein [Chelativorans alearense]|uniref:hypothetical protein n=1 Tax=Chelativorans alearense TaxID=2681495 RepID=UPI0013D658B2|nr:hypothetical protein [Chelativorans alearense]
MTRRVDALRIDTPRPASAEREARNEEALRSQPIRRRNIENVDLQTGRARESDSPERSAVTDAEFSSQSHPSPSVDELLAHFVAPEIPEPAILRRSVPILQHCIADLVPNLSGGEQLHDLAKALMEEEIERQRSLLDRMQEGLGG